MRCHQLVGVVALAAAVMAGCGGDAPTSVGRSSSSGAALSLQGSEGREAYTYGEDESRELRRHLLTSVGEDEPIARGRRKQIILRSFAVGADNFHYALAYGERTGPPTYSVLVKNGRPVALVRYQWAKRGRRWQSEAAQLTFWNQQGVPVLTGAVENERSALRELSAVVERVTFAILARAVRPAQAQLYFNECFAEYMDLASAAAALAVLIAAPDPTALTKLAAITVASLYAKAVFKLNECIAEHHEGGSPPHEGEGGGESPEGGSSGDGGAGGGSEYENELMALLRALIEDCENRDGIDCLYTFS